MIRPSLRPKRAPGPAPSRFLTFKYNIPTHEGGVAAAAPWPLCENRVAAYARGRQHNGRVFVSTARATPPNLSFADCDTLSTLFLLYGSLWNVSGCFSRNLNVSAPALSPLILQPDSSGYGAASTVLCGLAVFHSAVLGTCQYAAGPLRHQGDHLLPDTASRGLSGVAAAAHVMPWSVCVT